jgi:hypothetical protein
MKINILDGSVDFAEGAVAPSMERQAFLDTSLGRGSRQELMNKEWWHFHVRPEAGVAANILYHGDKLHEIYVLLEVPSDEGGDWSEKHELERKAIHDTWLRRELGEPPYHYAWGRVVSEYDAKGCVSEIILVYDR